MTQTNFQPLSMKKNVVWNTVGSVFYQGCLWLMTVLVVRLSGDYQNSGSLAFAMSIGNIYTALGTYTMRTYQVADVDDRYSASNYVAIRLITVLGAIIGCCIYGLIVSPSTLTLLTVVSFLLFKADESFVNVLYGCDQKSLRLDYVGKSQMIRGCVIIAFFIAGMTATHSLPITLALIAGSCFLVTILFDLKKTSGLVESLKPRISSTKAFALLKALFPTALGNILAGLVTSAARQYFGIVYGEEALGIYASVATPCVIIQVLAQNLYAPMLGPIAELKLRGKYLEAKRRAKTLLLLVIGVALSLSAVLILCSRWFLGLLYGDSILPYITVLPPALAVTTGIAALFVITDLLIVYNKLKQTLVINMVAFAVMIISLVPCTAQWYMNGLNLSLILGYFSAVVYGLTVLARE